MCKKQRMTPWRQFAGISIMFILAALHLIGPETALATHFPPGAVCMDCHAVSASKMVPGSHLVKKSWRTTELGYTTGANAPCLFCHDWTATGVGNSPSSPAGAPTDVVMKGVREHFSSLSKSRHRVSLQSNATVNPATFDCVDCHTQITSTVDSDPNMPTPNVHGNHDASAVSLPIKDTLIGWLNNPAPYDDANLSQIVCKNSSCHGGLADNSFGTRTARQVHSFSEARIHGAATQPISCPECHGKHNSYFSEKLLVLKLDGTTSNNEADDPTTFVTPRDCGECHDQDDGGAFATSGHGQPTMNPAPLTCSNCHDYSVPHSFVWQQFPSGNTNRFALTEGTETSSLTQKNASSICTNCHQQYSMLHSNSGMKVGCLDCHEPHGKGVGTNIKMIRQQIPADYTEDTGGTLQLVDQGVDEVAMTYASRDDFFRGVGLSAGVCDNIDCHGGVTFTGKTTSVYPLGTYMTSGQHSGGDLPDPLATPTDCTSCHAHVDSAGLWKASSSCDKCHGQPPNSSSTAAPGYTTIFAGIGFDESKTPHFKHAGDYGLHCTTCHLKYNDGGWHNTGGLTIGPPPVYANDTQASFQSVYFAAAKNPSTDQLGTGIAPFDHSASYDVATNQCSDLYCHSDGQKSTSVNASPVTWGDAGNWAINDLACNSCHGASNGTAGTMTYGAPDHANGDGQGANPTANSHSAHSAFACAYCHYATTTDENETDGWTITGKSSHVDGAKTLYSIRKGSGNALKPDFDVVGGSNPTQCQNISCHGGNSATWGVSNLPCENCHLRTAVNGGDANDFTFGNGTTAVINQDQWQATGHGLSSIQNYATYPADPDPNAGAGFANCTDNCHTSAIPHNAPNNYFRLRTFALATPNFNNTNTDPQEDITVCLDCHSSGGDNSGASVLHVEENHFGTKHQGNEDYGGSFCWDCHDPHGDGNPFMIHGDSLTPDSPPAGDGVTDQSDGVFGIPATSRPVRGLDLTDGYTSDDLVVNVTNDGLCQTCHGVDVGNPANYFRRNLYTALSSHNGANITRCTACHLHSQDFKPQGCDRCHGFPPVLDPGGTYCSNQIAIRDAGSPNFTAQCENYPGGGGAHKQHIDVFKSKLNASEYDSVAAVCAPCHGEDMTTHATSIVPLGFDVALPWPAGVRDYVNIRARANNSWDGGTAPLDIPGKYNGIAVAVGGLATGNGSAYAPTGDATNQCEGVDCHGNPTAADNLYWSTDVADNVVNDEDALLRSTVCEGCHDESPAQLRIYDLGGTNLYTGDAPDAAANYYGTLSGYGRGGHGDAEIQNEDPFVDSAPGVATPIDCTACHNALAAHFPEAAGNIHRLTDPTKLETDLHASTDICNRCHDGAEYPGTHHPSYYKATGTKPGDLPEPVEPAAGQEILTRVDGTTTWGTIGVVPPAYAQNAYGAELYSGNPDGFVKWWGGAAYAYGSSSQDPPPKPVFYGEAQTASPKAILPLERYILDSGLSNRVMCVTCHNPHGTDLFVYDNPLEHGSTTMAKKIADNNMLRLLDDNNSLCQACH